MMNSQKKPIVLLDESSATAAKRSGELEVFDIETEVFSEPVRMYIGARDCPAKLSDIVPVCWWRETFLPV